MGKKHHVPHTLRTNKRVHHPFKLIHYDIWGPCLVNSTLYLKYSIVYRWLFVCDMVIFNKNHSKELSIFETLYNEIKNQFNVSINTLWTNNSKEFC